MLLVSKFQHLDSPGWMRKYPQNRAHNLEDRGFRHIKLRATHSVVCNAPAVIILCTSATILTELDGHLDRNLSHVHPVSFNLFTKSRTVFTEIVTRRSI